jgi:hypothetical protein
MPTSRRFQSEGLAAMRDLEIVLGSWFCFVEKDGPSQPTGGACLTAVDRSKTHPISC